MSQPERYRWFIPKAGAKDKTLTSGVVYRSDSLTTSFAIGCKSNVAIKIISPEKPTAVFDSDSNSCIGKSIGFTDNPLITQGSIVNWQWIFGDENVSTCKSEEVFDHPYSNAGNYPITVRNANGFSHCRKKVCETKTYISHIWDGTLEGIAPAASTFDDLIRSNSVRKKVLRQDNNRQVVLSKLFKSQILPRFFNFILSPV